MRAGTGSGPDVLMTVVIGFLLSQAKSGTPCGFSGSNFNTPSAVNPGMVTGRGGFHRYKTKRSLHSLCSAPTSLVHSLNKLLQQLRIGLTGVVTLPILNLSPYIGKIH